MGIKYVCDRCDCPMDGPGDPKVRQWAFVDGHLVTVTSPLSTEGIAVTVATTIDLVGGGLLCRKCELHALQAAAPALARLIQALRLSDF